MSGTPLNPARLANLMATVAKSFPLGQLTDEACKSWEENGAELARRIAFLAEIAPSPKRKGKAPKTAIVKPAEFFVMNGLQFFSSDLMRHMDFSPCLDDERELSYICPLLPQKMNDTAIDIHAGGKGTLLKKRATLPQLMHEFKRVVYDKSGLFKEGGNYILYLEGKDGNLYHVQVFWSSSKRLYALCYPFDGESYENTGSHICGNEVPRQP